MKASRKLGIPDRDIRHFIYTTFAGTCRPPTTSETAGHFGVSIAAVVNAYERLAAAHHIALAPGSHAIWMAHPFSGIPTNYAAWIASASACVDDIPGWISKTSSLLNNNTRCQIPNTPQLS